MKILLIILATILISCHGLAYGGDTGDSIITTYSTITMDKFKKLMKNGNETLGIPVLDPFELKRYMYQIDEKHIVKAEGILRFFEVDELSNFKVIKADFNLIGIEINLHLLWDTIKLVTNYSFEGILMDFLTIYGFGAVKANVKGLDIAVNMSLSTRDDNIYVYSFESAIKLKELDLNITGLFYDKEISRIASVIISDMTPQLIEDYQVEVTKKFNTLVTNFINDFLKNKSWMDLISILSFIKAVIVYNFLNIFRELLISVSKLKMIRSIIIYTVIFISYHAFAHEQKENYSINMKPFLERFKTVMKTGNESLKIPVFDPYNRVEETLHVNLSYISADTNLKNLHISGLSNYQVKQGKFMLVGLQIEVGFHWEEIATRSKYNINGTAANKYPIYGKGKLVGIIKGLDVTCNLRMRPKGNKLEVSSITSTVNLKSLDLNVTGLYNDEKRSKEVSKKISEKAPEIIRKYPVQAGIIMSEIALKKVNQIIGNKSIKDLLDLIRP
uniref:uncharacterized protein LOC127065810 n=1 Tax=Vespula vulgaris TaxID=7454 RepID=UPI00223B04FF|nr:uncharacterized protein LOC127065810 [Vespula vulgaris]